ncbi:hypothetical protein [Streptomyces nanshensis]|uniref:Uncharacterized protein n=1 Tax=Streptomyces nanshensis TaxID=518642 RepID=A0A1E7LA09_9ACTN|nr:hypothetical protein [Streptomyces nanshensis]OEV12980.1 hypothetical protein AN218_05575 [Streptomyces nanshensis]
MDGLDDALGADVSRIARARQSLEDACAGVVEMAQAVEDFTGMGTDELPAAVTALASSQYLDEDEGSARWVSKAFTASPMSLVSRGEAALAFGGAVMVLRGALHELDQAVAAAGPTAPGGTFSS